MNASKSALRTRGYRVSGRTGGRRGLEQEKIGRILQHPVQFPTRAKRLVQSSALLLLLPIGLNVILAAVAVTSASELSPPLLLQSQTSGSVNVNRIHGEVRGSIGFGHKKRDQFMNLRKKRGKAQTIFSQLPFIFTQFYHFFLSL